jgi:hypothetical protein
MQTCGLWWNYDQSTSGAVGALGRGGTGSTSRCRRDPAAASTPWPEVSCELPPTTVAGWQQWATTQLGALAAQEVWQPGRYGYTVERRDRTGNTVQLLSRGVWQLTPLPAR